MAMNRFAFPVATLILAATLGCGSSNHSTATGKVTVAGQPVSTGKICFIKPAMGVMTTGDLGPDGSYKIEDGLPPGGYVVFVVPTTPDSSKSSIPAKYQSEDTSDIIVKINPGRNSDLNFALD